MNTQKPDSSPGSTPANLNPNEARKSHRRAEKAAGRNRRAEMMLDRRQQEEARQDELAQQLIRCSARLDRIEAFLVQLDASFAEFKVLAASNPTPNAG